MHRVGDCQVLVLSPDNKKKSPACIYCVTFNIYIYILYRCIYI